MSRIKRQRTNTEGQARVTSISNGSQDLDGVDKSTRTETSRLDRQQGRSLYVHGLPEDATTESLTNFFSQSYPLKHATVVVDPTTKKPKGYGFVTFTDLADARSAQASFDRSLFDGQKLKVKFAEPRHRQVKENATTKLAEESAHLTRPTGAGLQAPPKLIIRNLPWTIKDSEALAVLFRSYGKVKHATLPKKKPGLSAGYGFVVLRGKKNAERALEGLNGKEIQGRNIAVDWAVEKDIWENLQDGIEKADEHSPSQGGTAVAAEGSTASDESSEGLRQDIIDTPSELGDELEGSDDGNVVVNGEGDDLLAHDVDANADANLTTDRGASTLFVRNLPFSVNDESLQEHFGQFGPVRYARIVLDHATERPRGTGFVCFYASEAADRCLREAPKVLTSANQSSAKQSLLEDTSVDRSGCFTLEGRVLHLSRAVDRTEAARLTFAGNSLREARDKDKRRLYLLSEGTVPSGTPLYEQFSQTESKVREDSAKQRQTLIRNNPTLHLSLTRLSVRQLPRSITSKDLKALAREAVVGFAKEVKESLRRPLSKEELARGGEEMREAERTRKAKGKGIVKQAKVVFEGREGGKVTESSGAGRSRGYGFIEYSSHRWALMGLRWLNGRSIAPVKQISGTKGQSTERKSRLIVEFSIENAQVVARRHERESKARRRSRMVSEKEEKGEIPAKPTKKLSRDQLMAKTRKGMKRKRGTEEASSKLEDRDPKEDPRQELDKAAKRQQIIGRKRMMRRSKNRLPSR
ncbi:RNA recognition motif-containing protein [Puttea exsequens]|nr:RNA recognition motif-containing protein [Puttea exsequens]